MNNTDLQAAHNTLPVDPFQLSASLLVLVAFPRSPSKSFQMALSIAQTADIFRVAEIGGQQMHLAGFGKSAVGAGKALALLELVKGWKGTMMFSAGHLLRDATSIVELLECFMRASTCRDKASHCHVVIDDPDRSSRYGILRVTGSGLQMDPPKRKSYVFPCALLFKRYLIDPSHPSSYQDQTQAAAVERGIHVCPYFDPDDLRELD